MTVKNNGVLVVVEVAESQPVDLGLEMLGLARQLIDGLGGVVTAVAFGAGLENIGETLIAHGADQVLVNDNTIFADFHAEAWLPDLSKIIFVLSIIFESKLGETPMDMIKASDSIF